MMQSFKEFLSEGVYDPGIFKVVFMAGGPGSGKSFILEQFIKQGFHRLGLRIVGSDVAFEYFLKKAGMGTDADTVASPEGQRIRNQVAKPVTNKKMSLMLEMRLGMVIDGTAKNYTKVDRQAKLFESLGYDSAMVFVNTDLETAIQRNRERERSLKDEIVTTAWHEAQSNMGKYSNRFKRHFFIIDNSNNSNWKQGVSSVFKQVEKWTKETPRNPLTKQWFKQEIYGKRNR